METAIFVGGPLHGEYRDVRDGQWTIVADESVLVAFMGDPQDPYATVPTSRKVSYARQRFVILGREILAYVIDGRRYDRKTYADLLDLILTPEAKGAIR